MSRSPRGELSMARAHERLTRAERAVLALVLDGWSNLDIARRRRRSERTVAKQVSAICTKFGVTTRRELCATVSGASPPEGGGTGVRDAMDASPVKLTDREAAVLELVASGRSNKAVAYELGLSPSTVGVLLWRARAKIRTRGASGAGAPCAETMNGHG